MFWLDSWLPNGPICRTAPNLFRAVARHRRKCSVKDALYDWRWTRDITGVPTAVVLPPLGRHGARSAAAARLRPFRLEVDRLRAATTPPPLRTARSLSA